MPDDASALAFPGPARRNHDERDVAAAGEGRSARPMLAKDRGGFVDEFGLRSEAQYAASAQMRRVIDEIGLEMVRFAFVDQHGLLRGKTIARSAVAAAMRSGLTAPSSLLLKDTSGKSVFPVFAPDAGLGVRQLSGAGDVVLVPDPTTFRVLPWAARTGWILCDLRFPDGSDVAFSTRDLLRRQLSELERTGYRMTVGAELEFHVFRPVAGVPGAGPRMEPTSPGSQLLHEEGLDTFDDLVQALYRGLTALDLPLRSIELEFGPSQLEITMEAADAAETADAVVLCRSAVRQIARRLGYEATFMSRPQGAESASTGWHLHQSLTSAESGQPVFAAPDGLSPVARGYLEGLLTHARGAAAFSTPTVNGYKRYQPYSLAPDRVAWGVDNKGAMVRAVIGGAGTRLENRTGEPAANPYLYIASQLVSGLDGMRRGLALREPVANPYESDAPRLPRSLGEAVEALEHDPVFADALGADTVAWYAAIKRREFERYLLHVSDWEQREYLGMF